MTTEAHNGLSRPFDVAIVGLGPVGCLAAILFAEAGLKVVAVEKEVQVYTLPRAVNLDGEIIRALQPIGLAETVNQMMQPIRANERAGFANSKREWLFGGNAVAVGSSGWQSANMFDQPELESFLRTQALSHANVSHYVGYEVTEFFNSPTQVTLNASGIGKSVSLTAKYLVACDGANSPTRKALGVGLRDLGYDQDWLVVDVEMLKTHNLPNEVLQVCDPDRIHTHIATKDPYRRWEFQLNPGESAEQMLETDTIHALLDSWTPRDTYKLRRTAVYQFHAAIADSWQRGRVFLAGDAAHQTPPFLGQGMNSGMRDVINLAWKLPLVLKGACAQSLLDTYQTERDAHAHDLVSWAVDMGHLMQHMAATEAAERVGEAPPEMQQTSRSSGYGQGREQPPIRSGVVLVEQVSNQGATGYLLAQPVVRDTTGKEQRFDELLGTQAGLITQGSVALNENSRALVEALSIKVIDLDEIELLQGKYPAELTSGESVLLRPDRLVFGHTEPEMSVDQLVSSFATAIGLDLTKILRQKYNI